MLVSAFKAQVEKAISEYINKTGIRLSIYYHNEGTYSDMKYKGYRIYQQKVRLGHICLHKDKIVADLNDGNYKTYKFAFQALEDITKNVVKGCMEIYQPNPTEEYGKCTKGDCAIRAMSKLMGLDWRGAFDVLCNWAREHYCIPNSLEDSLVPCLHSMGFMKINTPDRPTAQEFAIAHPNGTYYLHVQVGYGSHAIALIDGTLYDAWDSSDRHLYYAMRKKETKTT